VYEAGEAAGVLFIAMRFVAGDDLRVVVSREGALRPRRAAAFISPVASALDAAHDAGLVHRDVKPANMLVDVGPHRPEHVYLSDFGVARGVVSSSGLTKAGQFLGTPDYAAPEQVSGQAVDVSLDSSRMGIINSEGAFYRVDDNSPWIKISGGVTRSLARASWAGIFVRRCNAVSPSRVAALSASVRRRTGSVSPLTGSVTSIACSYTVPLCVTPWRVGVPRSSPCSWPC